LHLQDPVQYWVLKFRTGQDPAGLILKILKKRQDSAQDPEKSCAESCPVPTSNSHRHLYFILEFAFAFEHLGVENRKTGIGIPTQLCFVSVVVPTKIKILEISENF